MKEREPVAHRITTCPNCGGRLKAGKNPYTSAQGFLYRVRKCGKCGKEVHTKQGPEEVTGLLVE